MRRLFIYDVTVFDVIRENGVLDDQLRALENAIMRGDGDTIAGTAGLKKIRCAAGSRGKSGSVRVIFADYPVIGRTYLLAAFGKNEKDNVTKAEARELGAVKRALDKVLEGYRQHAKRN